MLNIMKECINNMIKREPLVSVVIPYYNNEKTILRAVKSALFQTYRNLEIIIIDDGSKDNSYCIVCDFLEKVDNSKKIKHIQQKNQGPSVARNQGILSAEGEFIAFLDADDSWEQNKLELQMEILNSDDSIDMISCNFNIISQDGTINKHYFVKDKLTKIEFKKMLYKHYYATPCVIAKKNALISCGMFNENQHFMEDSLLFTKICRDYNAYMTNDFLVNTYKNSFGESGLSGQLNKMQKYEYINFLTLYKDNKVSNEKMSMMELSWCFIFSTLKFLRRKLIVLFRK